MKQVKVFFAAALCLLTIACKQSSKTGDTGSIIVLESGWKFNTGNDPNWADPVFDDSGWKPILVDRYYELQGWPEYNGFSWYRIKFNLPSSMKEVAYLKDSVQVFLGMIDDYDITYLNGKIIGMDAKNVPSDQDTTGFTKERPSLYDVNRKYMLSVNDERILWDKENVIAIKVYDPRYAGGLNGPIAPYVSMIDLRDLLSFDIKGSPFRLADGTLSKTFSLENVSAKNNFSGKLSVKIQTIGKSNVIFEDNKNIEIKTGEKIEMPFSFKTQVDVPCIAIYTFTENASNKIYEVSQEVPYILTPEPAEAPRITGAKVYGAHPDNQFIFRVTAIGNKPMSFSAKDLPAGLTLDASTGVISGSVKKDGEYKTLLTVKNDKGEAVRELKIIIGDKIALTPPMGWNSWNCWGLSVDDQKVRQAIDYMVTAGLADHGWSYINIDDGWEVSQRLADGRIVPNEKFPDMKKLSDYLHGKGFKFGVYSSPGTKTCGGFLGSYQHELQDAKSWASWGVDYIKYDWCSYSEIAGKDNSLNMLKKPYILMRESLNKVNRDIVLSLCQYGMGNVWEWGGEIGGNLWRTTGDISDNWASMTGIGFNQAPASPYAKPGNWNDPDMMVVGWVGWGPALHPTNLTINEQYTHVSLWCLLAAPLLLGNDLSRLDDFTIGLLTNEEVLEIDQDPLGKQAVPIYKQGEIEIWAKDLEDGSKAVGLFNLSRTSQNITLNWADLKVEGKQIVRDLWRQKDTGEFESKFEAEVFSHGVVFVKVTAQK